MSTAVARRVRVSTVWTCQFCKNGLCGSCPGRVDAPLGEGKSEPWFCECGKGHRTPYCTLCKNEHPDEVNPDEWVCVDSDVCYGRVRARQENSELWQMLQRCKSAAALARKSERLRVSQALIDMDPVADQSIEQEHAALLAAEEQAKAERKARPRQTPPRPKSGVCECGCGGATRGGRFQPGHDAKLASRLKDRVRAGDASAYAEMVRRNWTKKLPAALRSEWENKSSSNTDK